MAFMGVLLGLFARVAVQQGLFESLGYLSASDMDAEMGLPVLLRAVLPVGLMGLMMSAYFSAIMSTADSCLMAASGNIVTDIMSNIFKIPEKKLLRYSQFATLIIGTFALLLATLMTNVLELMLLSYSFMVSGLFVPLIAGLFFKKKNPNAALASMLVGGSVTIVLEILKKESILQMPFGVDPNIFGILMSLLTYLIISNRK